MRVTYIFLYAFAYSQQLSFYNNKKQYKKLYDNYSGRLLKAANILNLKVFGNFCNIQQQTYSYLSTLNK